MPKARVTVDEGYAKELKKNAGTYQGSMGGHGVIRLDSGETVYIPSRFVSMKRSK